VRLVLEDWGFGEQVRAGRGVRTLFIGAPGTGKSLAVAVAQAAITFSRRAWGRPGRSSSRLPQRRPMA